MDELPLFGESDADLRAQARILAFDVDDTLTWRGQLPEPAARALYAAQQAGLSLIAVTGRSYAWAEMLLRLFPLEAAVAETGAVALLRGASFVEVLHHEPDEAVRAAGNRERDRAAARALAEVNGARLAIDNPGRLYDVAFDLIESGPPVPDEDARRLRAVLEQEGLTTARSSVHVNAWKVGPHGPFDKATMTDRVLRRLGHGGLDDVAGALCYLGDSTNDGAMFARARLSVGVANLRPHLAALRSAKQAPRYRTAGEGGHGFAEAVAALLAPRRA
ncbi:MAG: HAD family phosphatase [Deltaproteobacteria bacterium]|nr:HAD family phosphatase [Deltaproteobacteria bacterium]